MREGSRLQRKSRGSGARNSRPVPSGRSQGPLCAGGRSARAPSADWQPLPDPPAVYTGRAGSCSARKGLLGEGATAGCVRSSGTGATRGRLPPDAFERKSGCTARSARGAGRLTCECDQLGAWGQRLSPAHGPGCAGPGPAATIPLAVGPRDAGVGVLQLALGTPRTGRARHSDELGSGTRPALPRSVPRFRPTPLLCSPFSFPALLAQVPNRPLQSQFNAGCGGAGRA